jgi:xanthine dehydrogenase small subunit
MASIRFTINDREVVVAGDVAPTTPLLSYLRDHLRLTGTKEGCAEGDCGACTVVVLDEDASGKSVYRAVNSCLILVPMMHGRQLYTVEALKSSDHHPVQSAMVDQLGSQCGYCTPGFVMSMFEACYRQDIDDAGKLDDQLCGNLCRCTGYRPIRDAARELVGIDRDDRFARKLLEAPQKVEPISYEVGSRRFFLPTTFDALFEVMAEHEDARLICGGTDLSLEVTKAFRDLPCLISLEGIPQLRHVESHVGGLKVGATVPLTDLERISADGAPLVARILRYFGSRQIKHRATIGGNLCNASPIGDLPPVLLALGAQLQLRSATGTRTVSIDDFFVDYRKTALEPGEILEAVDIPNLRQDARAGAYKVSRRRELDISAVAAGFVVRVGDSGDVIDARLAFGGMAAVPLRARTTEAARWSPMGFSS